MLTHRDVVDNTVIGKAIILIKDDAATLHRGAHCKVQGVVGFEAVDVLCEDIDVRYDLVDEHSSAHRDLLGSK